MSSTQAGVIVHHATMSDGTQLPSPRPRFAVLDGIRGIAALYVALYHAMGYTGYRDSLSSGLSIPGQVLTSLLNYGTYAVPIFIVLSGFSLMLPLAQRGISYIPDGSAAYIRRRAWRILPAYYAALVISLGLIALLPVLQTPTRTMWDTKIPITPAAVISHLLLLHDLNVEWIYKINGPMWSVAVEWQIYFLFPAVLLPILRRSNIAVTVGAAMILGMLPHLLLPKANNLDDAHPWFIGLFAIGMAAAMITYSSNSRIRAHLIKFQRVWTAIGLTLGLMIALAVIIAPQWMDWHAYLSEPIVGLIVAYWLFRYAHIARTGGHRTPGQRILESRTLVGLGAFSYSIYLIHNSIQALFNLWTLNLPMSLDLRLLMMVGVATPISLLFAYGFYLLIERRFLQLKERPRAEARLLHTS